MFGTVHSTYALLLAFASGTLGLSCSGQTTKPDIGQTVHPIAATYSRANYDFLDGYLTGRSIVQLGESIHVTDEFPRERLRIVEHLHTVHNFDIIAFEGSLLSSWLAQDTLFNSTDPFEETVTRAQSLAWFGLWQTDSMRAVMEYVAESQKAKSPLYLASFDIQPGNNRKFGGDKKEALRALIDAVQPYASSDEIPPGLVEAIAPHLGCYRARKTSEQQVGAALVAISQLSEWLAQAIPTVEKRTSLAHATALRLIPDSLRGTIELCRGVASGGQYQEIRDQISARNSLVLRNELSAAHRVILWAHHSHIAHNATGKNVPSMGQHLLAADPDGLYTIGVFAGSGRALQVDDDAFPPIVPRRIRPASDYGLEGTLAMLCENDSFIDFSQMRPAQESYELWFREQTTRMELSGATSTVPALDFHAALYISEVSPGELSMLPGAITALLTAYGYVLDHPFLTASGFAILLLLIVRYVRNRRRRRRNRVSR